MAPFQKVKLGDICDLQQGLCINRKSKHLIIEKSDLPLLRITDLINNKQEQYINPDLVGPQFIADENSLIYTRTGQVGLVFKNRKGVVHNNCFKILPKQRLDKDFLFYSLKQRGLYDNVVRIASKAAQPDLTHSAFKSVEINLPNDIQIQKQIASVLSSYDSLIENNEKRIKTLEEMSQLLYTEWFVKFKFPGFEKVKMVDSKTEYGMIPAGWSVKRFYDVVNNLDSKRKPISSMKRRNMQGIYPYYGAAKIIDQINDYIFDGRYLLIAEDGSVVNLDGKPMLQFVDEKFWVSNHAHIVQGKLLSTEILYLRLCRFNIKPLITGSAQPKITKDNLSRILFIIPNENIKVIFINMVSRYFDEIFNLQKQNKYLSQTRDLLIPQLINGKRELKN